MKIDDRTKNLVIQALEEDHASCDLSTLWCIPNDVRADAQLLAREEGIFCGGRLFTEVFETFDAAVRVELLVKEGSTIETDQKAAKVTGPARAILSAERTALNLIGRLSGIATETSRYVERVHGTPARICDTRKTTPLWRKWEKYAVRMGGGTNHRSNLEEMILLKDNHASLAGGPAAALRSAKDRNTIGVEIEVEVDTLDQLREVLDEGVDRILLDNMSIDELHQAVAMNSGRARLEASGGVTLDTVREIAETGVDCISVGALTHSVKNSDFSLEIS